ncbi:hypothetical protein NEISICOT_01081 [Neisseria sicca ATCC 29256]|uniref:Uncharacterized protein n=1 Tax=Neisseria sicca ATCC 29256 TaxID=547045 RepID=C6M3D3_NEISI|nr:hypothetical protein NEISICOT_01081 [Neisseria sicca ATCC 29256]
MLSKIKPLKREAGMQKAFFHYKLLLKRQGYMGTKTSLFGYVGNTLNSLF